MYTLQAARYQAEMFETEAIAGMEREVPDELLMLSAANVMHERLNDWQFDLVRRLRAKDVPVPWAAIGEAMGMTKQAAMARYAKQLPPF